MKVVSYTKFRTTLKGYLDNVEQNNETAIIKSGIGKGTVLMSLRKYKSMKETMHLLGSKANANRLFESIDQMRKI